MPRSSKKVAGDPAGRRQRTNGITKAEHRSALEKKLKKNRSIDQQKEADLFNRRGRKETVYLQFATLRILHRLSWVRYAAEFGGGYKQT